MAWQWLENLNQLAGGVRSSASDAAMLGTKDWWRMASGGLNDQEKDLMNRGMSAMQAVAFIRRAPITSTEQWLMGKGMTPLAARAFAQQEISLFETALMMKGVPPEKARQEAKAPVLEYDIKSAVVQMMDGVGPNLPELAKPITLTDAIAKRLPLGVMTREELYRMETMMIDGDALIPLADPLVAAIADRYRPHPSPNPTVVASAVQAKAGITHTGSSAVLAAVTGEVIPQSWEKIEITRPDTPARNTIQETILSLLSGKEVSKTDIEALQQALNAQGYKSGKEDGKAGKATWKAVAAYAKDHMKQDQASAAQLKIMEQALKEIGYRNIVADGDLENESLRAVDKFFRLRNADLGNYKPAHVEAPDMAALAAIQSGLSKKRGLVAKAG